MPRLSHSSRFDRLIKIWRGVQIIKLLNTNKLQDDYYICLSKMTTRTKIFKSRKFITSSARLKQL